MSKRAYKPKLIILIVKVKPKEQPKVTKHTKYIEK